MGLQQDQEHFLLRQHIHHREGTLPAKAFRLHRKLGTYKLLQLVQGAAPLQMTMSGPLVIPVVLKKCHMLSRRGRLPIGAKGSR